MRVLILKMGTTEPSVVVKHGDYDDWFRRILEGLGCEVSIAAVFKGEELSDDFDGDAILLTGSPLSVCDQEPWMQRAGMWSLQQAERGYPVLGVCFGHQLLGECLGARVAENPRGPEWGTIEVESSQDPLFEGLPKTLIVQASHRDVLIDVPPGARVLMERQHGCAGLLLGQEGACGSVSSGSRGARHP